MVGSTNVVVVGGLLGVVIEGADVGATVEGTAVVEVGADVGSADAVESFAVALGSALGRLTGSGSQNHYNKRGNDDQPDLSHLMTPCAPGNEV